MEVLGNENDKEKRNLVAQRSWNGKYLAGTPEGGVRLINDTVCDCEKWKVIHMYEEWVALQSFHGMYLCCDDFWQTGKLVTADRMEANRWEHWMILPVDLVAIEAASYK